MSFHIVTLLRPGVRLSVDRGFLVCRYPNNDEKRIALADVRAMVVGTPAVSFTQECLARLLEQDSVVLHCDSHYKPIGWSVALERVTRKSVFDNQISLNIELNRKLWKAIILQKMLNQAALLDYLELSHNLYPLIDKPLASEANVAKQFWKLYFPAIGEPQRRERRGAESFENRALNYGYAVLSTLVHRAVLIHGLLPSLGIHHESRYRNTPLVYDLLEPFRSFVELILAKWSAETQFLDSDFTEWVRFLMESLRTCRIKMPQDKHSRKLMDAIDHYVRCFSACYEDKHFTNDDITPLWLPDLKYHYWLMDDQADEPDDEEVTQAAM
jgi:CRISPR-associated endonuclease Cas1 subtype II